MIHYSFHYRILLLFTKHLCEKFDGILKYRQLNILLIHYIVSLHNCKNKRINESHNWSRFSHHVKLINDDMLHVKKSVQPFIKLKYIINVIQGDSNRDRRSLFQKFLNFCFQ